MKDPAFLFYPNDYIGGTMGMTFEEKGAYIELLMLQFNRGRLSEDIIIRIIGINLWMILRNKFIQDENQLWYNERLEEEQNKRKAYSESRRQNRNYKANLKPHKSDSNETCIYIIKDIETNNIKIGASFDPKGRLGTLKYKLKKDLVLLAYFNNCTLKDEKEIHAHFIENNINGDWFNIDEESVIHYIINDMNKHMINHMEDRNKDKDIILNKEEYYDCFIRYIKFRKDIKKAFKSKDSIETSYKKLLKLSNNNPEIATEIVEQSIANGWQGLFELKQNNGKQNNRPTTEDIGAIVTAGKALADARENR